MNSEARKWLLSRPRSLWPLICQFPPVCKAITKPGITLAIPAPGVIGEVVSYFEPEETYPTGLVGVSAPSEISFWVTRRAQCAPDDLLLFAENPECTRTMVTLLYAGAIAAEVAEEVEE